MKTRLAIDCGNTSTKLSVWNAETDEFVTGTTLHSAEPGIASIEAYINGLEERPECAAFCTVGARDPELEEALKQLLPTIVVDASTPVPLKIDYKTPEKLGSDRLAAAVGAHALFPSDRILVVDMGTAITYDMVETEDTFAGGNIAPGLGMRLQSLHDHTSRLPRVATPRDFKVEFLFGEDTDQAILQGCILGILAEMEMYYDQLWNYDTKFVLTGRTAEVIAPSLGFAHVYDPHLVGRGLNAILKHNGQ